MGLTKLTGHFGDLAQQGGAMAQSSIQRIHKNVFHITILEVATVPDGRVLVANEHDTRRMLDDGFIAQGAGKLHGIWLRFAQSPRQANEALALSYPSLGFPTSRARTAYRKTVD